MIRILCEVWSVNFEMRLQLTSFGVWRFMGLIWNSEDRFNTMWTRDLEQGKFFGPLRFQAGVGVPAPGKMPHGLPSIWNVPTPKENSLYFEKCYLEILFHAIQRHFRPSIICSYLVCQCCQICTSFSAWALFIMSSPHKMQRRFRLRANILAAVVPVPALHLLRTGSIL